MNKQPPLTVFFDAMPESNGKRNWTVILCRVEGRNGPNITDGLSFARTEFYDQARYEADELRFLIGEIAVKPFILDYDEDLKCPVGHPLEFFDGRFPEEVEDDDSPSDLDYDPVTDTWHIDQIERACVMAEVPPAVFQSITLYLESEPKCKTN